MARIAIYEGYGAPFGAYRKKRKAKRSKAKLHHRVKKQQSKMKVCARLWKKKGSGKYISFMKKCLSK